MFCGSLQEAERLLQDHEQIRPEIDNYEDDFARLMEMGRKVCENQTDPQYLLLAERLEGIEDDWGNLHKMYEDRDNALKKDVQAQTFFRDALQADVIINKEETFVSKEIPVS